ncbi:MAG: hypothetical protein Q7W44_06805 [Coriobacteriia bacterium]|nr:hypothetical protein [Coriobacteriia bacterium]
MTATTARSRTPRALSAGTILTGGALIALVSLFALLSVQMYAGALSDAAYAASYWFGTSLQILFALVIIFVALRIGWGQHVGKQWLFVGLGVTAYAVGDIAWTILDLHLGLDPYPSVADVFYTLEYAFFFIAMVLAVRSYRSITDLRTPLIIGAVISVVAAAAMYFLLLKPYIFAAGVEELGTWGLVISTLYPLGDVFFMLAPAMTLAIVIMRLGAGRLAWPWWIVVVGALVFSVVDSLYSYADWSGAGSSTLLEMGWMSANLLFALAALVARDVYRVR